MSTQNRQFDVWTDGSYQSTRRRGGIGAVIDHKGERRTFAAALPRLRTDQINHGSDFAELYAIGSALDLIPPQAVVKLRSDCQNVLDWLQKGKLTCKKDTASALNGAFNYAMRGISRMESVEFIKTSDRRNEGTALAHQLSRQGASTVTPRQG